MKGRVNGLARLETINNMATANLSCRVSGASTVLYGTALGTFVVFVSVCHGCRSIHRGLFLERRRKTAKGRALKNGIMVSMRAIR